MHFIIRFQTSLFDMASESPNPINPIPGHSLLDWLRDKLSHKCELTVPEPEDWGWYSLVSWDGRQYLLGSSAIANEDGSYEWVLQVEKHRSLGEKLLSKERMLKDDKCLKFLEALIAAEPAFRDVAVE